MVVTDNNNGLGSADCNTALDEQSNKMRISKT